MNNRKKWHFSSIEKGKLMARYINYRLITFTFKIEYVKISFVYTSCNTTHPKTQMAIGNLPLDEQTLI